MAKRGSFSAAAKALSFTQPSVSRQIAALEREAGTRLLERDARHVRLTQAGELLLDHAEAILGRLATAEAQLQSLADLDGGRLRLAAFASANTWLVPEALRRFNRLHPRVELTLAAVPSHRHLAALRAGDIDIAILTDWDLPGSGPPSDVRLTTLATDTLHVALPRHHRLAGHARLSLADLAQETWIEGSHPDCLGPLEQAYLARGVRPRIGFHCDDWTGKQALVTPASASPSTPRLALGAPRPDITVRPLPSSLPSRDIYAAYPAGHRAPAVHAMLACLRESAQRARTQDGQRPVP